MWRCGLLLVSLLFACVAAQKGTYFGTPLGTFSGTQHGVAGEIYAVDSRTFYLRGFSFDGGRGQDAVFFVGKSGSAAASNDALQLADEKGATTPLKAYRAKDVVLTLPGGMTLKDVRWLAVFCPKCGASFGEVAFADRIQYPRPQKIPALRGVHEVASDR
jgi:hypothetical protein